MKNFTLEIACFSLAGALTAQSAGADRIELCENPADGGTTPSYGTLQVAREKINIPVFPIIRPRAGDFLYTKDECSIIYHDIKLCKSLGFEGIVVGVLNNDGSINTEFLARVVSMAYPMEVTFHRAFDRCKDPLESMEEVIESGCNRILTSGQFPAALEGATLIKKLVEQADDRIIIMPGSGVNSGNIASLISLTGANEFHASARMQQKSAMRFEVPEMAETLSFTGVNAGEVERMKTILNRISSPIQPSND